MSRPLKASGPAAPKEVWVGSSDRRSATHAIRSVSCTTTPLCPTKEEEIDADVQTVFAAHPFLLALRAAVLTAAMVTEAPTSGRHRLAIRQASAGDTRCCWAVVEVGEEDWAGDASFVAEAAVGPIDDGSRWPSNRRTKASRVDSSVAATIATAPAIRTLRRTAFERPLRRREAVLRRAVFAATGVERHLTRRLRSQRSVERRAHRRSARPLRFGATGTKETAEKSVVASERADGDAAGEGNAVGDGPPFVEVVGDATPPIRWAMRSAALASRCAAPLLTAAAASTRRLAARSRCLATLRSARPADDRPSPLSATFIHSGLTDSNRRRSSAVDASDASNAERGQSLVVVLLLPPAVRAAAAAPSFRLLLVFC